MTKRRPIKDIRRVEAFFKKIETKSSLIRSIFENDNLEPALFDELFDLALSVKPKYGGGPISSRNVRMAIISNPNFNLKHAKRLLDLDMRWPGDNIAIRKELFWFRLDLVKQVGTFDEVIAEGKCLPAKSCMVQTWNKTKPKLAQRWLKETRPKWSCTYERPSVLIKKLLADYGDVKTFLSSDEGALAALSENNLLRTTAEKVIIEEADA